MKNINWRRIGEILRLVDDNGNLSITNIVVLVATARVVTAPALSTPDLLALLGALVSYQAKRYMTPEPVPEAPAGVVTAMQAAIESMQTKITSLQLGGQIKR